MWETTSSRLCWIRTRTSLHGWRACGSELSSTQSTGGLTQAEKACRSVIGAVTDQTDRASNLTRETSECERRSFSEGCRAYSFANLFRPTPHPPWCLGAKLLSLQRQTTFPSSNRADCNLAKFEVVRNGSTGLDPSDRYQRLV